MSAPPLRQALARLGEALHVAPEFDSFAWFGREFGAVGAAATTLALPERRRSILGAITDCLYANFYCLGLPVPAELRGRSGGGSGHSAFVQSLVEAHDTETAWVEMAVEAEEASTIVTSYAGVAVHSKASSPLLKRGTMTVAGKGGRVPSRPRVSIGTRSWSLNVSPGFLMLSGRYEPRAVRRLHRLYWHVGAENAAALIGHITRLLNAREVPFRLKALADPAFYGRRIDTAILYLDLDDMNAQHTVRDAAAAVQDLLRREHPAMTLGLRPGLALAYDSGQAVSFGMHRCGLIAEAAIRAVSERAGHGGLARCAAEVFADAGVPLDAPYRTMADDAHVAQAVSAMFSSTAPRRNDRRPAARPPATALEVARDIGRALAAEAYWSKDRCRWIGGEPLGLSDQTVFRSIPPDLYGGTAGIGHCLAELAARTGEEELARTALGAIRQALSTAEPNGGLYVGGFGVAIVALRAARLLGDQSLATRALTFAEALLQSEPAAAADLLYGLAGQIVGLLVLERLVPEEMRERCVRRAADFGNLLAERAIPDGDGCSWQHADIDATSNLTGFSHGVAGIAYALAALWRRCRQPVVLASARSALAYEDRHFEARHANWADYRSRGGGPTKYSTFWCHGAPGVILSRLAIGEFLGASADAATLAAAATGFERQQRAGLHREDGNFSLCHGIAGNAEILAQVAATPDFPEPLRGQAAATAERCWQFGAAVHAARSSWPCGAARNNPSLLIGRAGIAYAYLRRADPAVPSVLAIDPERWGVIVQRGTEQTT